MGTMDTLLTQVRNFNPKADFALVRKAYKFAEMAHDGQKRMSGEPYIIHPLATAMILTEWKMDTLSVIAGLLHDTAEDGAATVDDIFMEFGGTVALLVEGVTKVGQLKLRGSTDEELVENLRKMFLAMAKDLRVVIIKLADRLHNMRTVGYLPPEKQKKFSRETIEIYAPLAERLGMGEVKGELEDLAFPYLYAEDYKWLKSYSAPAYKEAAQHVLKAKHKLMRSLAEEKIKTTINGREKHIYSLYKKLLRPEIEKDLNQIHDLVALRIIVKTVEECYMALGKVHQLYKPVPSLGMSDYIAVPKPNGYRSIHTRVFGPAGRIIEIQIRTEEMHEEAENGIAAHWHYASLKSHGTSDEKLEAGTFTPADKLSWVKQLVNWQKEIADNQEFMQTLKFDALSHRIFIFTPDGDVKDLPMGATPVDFAYAVHTAMGDRTVGAKVNGKMAGLNTKLHSGDVCEVVLSKEPRKPNMDWMEFVVTNLAKREIQKGARTSI